MLNVREKIEQAILNSSPIDEPLNDISERTKLFSNFDEKNEEDCSVTSHSEPFETAALVSHPFLRSCRKNDDC
jgi:hypothetical protein